MNKKIIKEKKEKKIIEKNKKIIDKNKKETKIIEKKNRIITFKFFYFIFSILLIIFLGASFIVKNTKITEPNQLLNTQQHETKKEEKENTRLKNTLKWKRKKIIYKYDGKEIEISLNDVKNVFKKEYDKKNKEIEYLFVFSIDKFKNIEKILEITSNKKDEVSYNWYTLEQKMKEKIKENENIIGFFEVHNHSPGNFEPSPADKLFGKKSRKNFSKEFGNKFFYDDFIYFKSDGEYIKENEYFINKINEPDFFVKIFM